MAISGDQIIAEGRKFLGLPYVFGAAGPKSFDCSGLVQYVLKQLGVSAPRTSNAQWGWVKKIQQADLQPGDLIFEQWPGDGPAPGHVVIYAGGGQVIEAPHTGADVRIRAWSPNETTIVGYGRVPGSSGSTGGGTSGGGLNLLSLALPQPVLDMFADAEHALQAMMWILNPENWVRIIAGVFGVFFAVGGITMLVGAA